MSKALFHLLDFIMDRVDAAFTALQEPSANKFRIGDRWLGPEGRIYNVQPGFRPGLVTLQPLSYNVPLFLKEDSVRHFRRMQWGGKY